MNAPNFNDEIGLEIKGPMEDGFVIELDVKPGHLNLSGIVHGGVICTLLDTVMAKACYAQLTEDRRGNGSTLEMKVNFFRPASVGKLTGLGRLTNLTRRTGFVEGEVKNEDGKLVAKASATMMLDVR